MCIPVAHIWGTLNESGEDTKIFFAFYSKQLGNVEESEYQCFSLRAINDETPVIK